MIYGLCEEMYRQWITKESRGAILALIKKSDIRTECVAELYDSATSTLPCPFLYLLLNNAKLLLLLPDHDLMVAWSKP